MGRTAGPRWWRPAAVALLGAFLIALWVATPVAGQGLHPDTTKRVSSSGSSSALAQLLMRSRAIKAAARTASQKQSCARSNSAIVCAAAAEENAIDEHAALVFATSPMAWSSTSPHAMAGGSTRQLVAPAGNQGACGTCAAFAVASAAETAVATAMYTDVSEISISVQALYVCPEPSFKRGCRSGWTFKEALTELRQRGAQLPTAQCMPYRPDPTGELGPQDVCSSVCSTSSSLLGQGSFSFEQIDTVWEGQRHILTHGAVVSRFDIFSDFRAFFKDKRNAKAVYRRREDATLMEPHAVVLVGYNNTGGFWIAKNSWGPDWGDGGLFRVAYGECNVLGSTAAEAYGITWRPYETPAAAMLPVTPAGSTGCYWYKARPGDFLSRIAFITRVRLNKLLEDNVDRIRDLDVSLAGTQLLLCGPAPGSFAVTGAAPPVQGATTAAVTPAAQVAPARALGPASPTPAAAQLEALLLVKASIDTTDVLKGWTREAGANGGFCKWRGIDCIVGGSVVWRLNIHTGTGIQGLRGQLPPASALRGLSELTDITISGQPGITGTLPADWAELQQLQDIRVSNISLSGELPPLWGRLKRLKVLYIWGNRLAGPLPDAWRGMAAMEQFDASDCGLEGGLPASWAAMTSMKTFYVFVNPRLGGSLPPSWSAMVAMEDFQAGNCSFTGGLPASWAAMTRMKTFYVYHNPRLGGPLPLSWSAMVAMERFEAQNCSLTGGLPASWASMTRMRIFYVFDNPRLGGPLPPSWAAMAAMEEFSAGNCSLEGGLPASWASMTRMKVLYVHTNPRLGGTLPPSWSAMAAMERFEAQNCSLTGGLPASWASMTRMRIFYVYDNPRLGGTLPPTWSAMAAIEQFEASNCNLEGAIPVSYESWTRLKLVALHTNPRLGGCLPRGWGAQLRSLDFHGYVYVGTRIDGVC